MIIYGDLYLFVCVPFMPIYGALYICVSFSILMLFVEIPNGIITSV